MQDMWLIRSNYSLNVVTYESMRKNWMVQSLAAAPSLIDGGDKKIFSLVESIITT